MSSDAHEADVIEDGEADAALAARPRRLRRVLLWTLSSLVVILLVVAGAIVWTVQRSFPQFEGEVAVPGLEANVTVQRDERGIPTITADTSADLFFAQGYVHAQDRFFEMDFRRHVTAGRVSEMFGESQLGTDAFLRTLGWRMVAEAEVAAMDEVTLSYYQSYADGVNAYLETHSGADLSVEYAILGIQNPDYAPEPWEPADSVAWLKAMAWDLRTNVQEESDRAMLASALQPEMAPGDVNTLLEQLYPAYPFATNPVIVPTPPEPPAESAEEQGNGDGGESGGNMDAAAADIPWADVSAAISSASDLIGSVGEGIGSNSWVVGGDLTSSGLPLLANDPHLGGAMPSVWYQVQLRCSTMSDACPFNVGGFSFSGLPGIVIGHNDRIAWGFTNLTTDVADLYVERIVDDTYVRDGALVPIDVRTETLSVAGGDDVELTVRSTVHGPIISGLSDDFTAIADDPVVSAPDDATGGISPIPLPTDGDEEYAVSLRWTALDPGNTATAIFAIATSQNFEEFQAAASLFDVPAQNLIYADVDGNIGYQTPGKLPIRGAGDGWLPQLGWDSAYDWTGFIPFEELPSLYNPESNVIVTANNAIVDDNYDYFLSRDWDAGYRAARITELIERKTASGPMTNADMRSIQLDKRMWIGNALSIAMADITVDDPATQEALDLLDTWDTQNTADSPAAAYANVLWSNLVQNIFAKRDVPLPVSGQSRLFTVVAAMLNNTNDPLWVNETLGVDTMEEMLTLSATDAYAELSSLQGSATAGWNWGGIHTMSLKNATFGSSGIAPLEWLFNRGPWPVGGGTSVVDATSWNIGEGYAVTSLPSMRMVIDLADFDNSTWNHLTGASGHPFHANYTDQTDDWAAGRQRSWAFTPDAVDGAAVHTLVLTPGG